jgi:hypothetical protein
VSVNYVNHLGGAWLPSAAATNPKRKSAAASTQVQHSLDAREGPTVSKGWQVEGFSPAHLAEAKRQHDLERDSQRGRNLRKGEDALGPWDEAAYMRQAKPKKVRPKPYALASSAELCADMARKEGWLGVRVREMVTP